MWSKKAVGRPGKGVSVQAKLNSPKPTPAHGCAWISASVFFQMPKREPEMSLSASRAVPPKLCCDSAAHCAMPHQAAA